jgi:chlorite dismutase
MPEQTPRTLNHFSFFQFQEPHAQLSPNERKQFHNEWLSGLHQAAQHTDVYQVYPAESRADILVWSALEADDPEAPARFMEKFACATNPYRNLLYPVDVLWGMTRPSQYTKTRSAQEIDPFAEKRQPYLVMYPFVKTVDWYLMSRDARQGMMNEHIRIGKQYPEITQLLLYSFGLQDQEFIVVYEMADLTQFSDLVYVLRDSEARRYTERDTPLYTGFYHPAEQTLALWD